MTWFSWFRRVRVEAPAKRVRVRKRAPYSMRKAEMRFEHLATNVPNNRVTRWLVARVNREMERQQSRYCLFLRGRKPRSGRWPKACGATVPLKDAKAFAIYLRPRRDDETHKAHERALVEARTAAWRREAEAVQAKRHQDLGAAIVEALKARGVDASWEYPGFIDARNWNFGTANGRTWAGSTSEHHEDVGRSVDLGIPAWSPNAEHIAAAIAATLAEVAS